MQRYPITTYQNSFLCKQNNFYLIKRGNQAKFLQNQRIVIMWARLIATDKRVLSVWMCVLVYVHVALGVALGDAGCLVGNTEVYKRSIESCVEGA